MVKVRARSASGSGRLVSRASPIPVSPRSIATLVMVVLLLAAPKAATAQAAASLGAGAATWQAVAQTPEIVAFFKDLFVRIGIVVTDTGERFTVHHLGDHIEFEPGIVEPVDCSVEITTLQVERLAGYARTGAIPPEEQYRVMKVVFTPATAALLAQPRLSSGLVRCFLGAERVIHVTLRSPLPTEEDVSHTLLYVRGRWVVVPGLYGRPQRIYHLALEDAIAFQKNSVAAVMSGKWLRYSRWYRTWRKTVSEKP